MKAARLFLAAVLLTLVAMAGTAGADPAPTTPSTVAGNPCGPAAGPACGKVVPPSSLTGPTTLGGAVGSGVDAAGGAVGSAVGSVIDAPFRAMASAFADAYGALLKQMLAAWVAVPTPSIDGSPNGAAGFIDSSVQFLVLWAAVLGLLITAARLVWQRKSDPAKDMAVGMGRLIVVTGCGVVGINLALQAGDAFSSWILSRAVGGGDPATQLATLGTASLSAVTSPGLLFVLGLLGLVGLIIQVGLLVVRSALLPILAGLFPLSAAASLTPMGSSWFRKTCGWVLALVLFKPASAIVYAVAIKLFTSPKTPLAAVEGVVIILMATLTLPALVKFIVPAVAAVGGISTAEVAAAGIAVATGAVVLAGTAGTGAAAMGAAGAAGAGPGGGGSGPGSGPGPGGGTDASGAADVPGPGAGSAGAPPSGAAPVTDPVGTSTGTGATGNGGGDAAGAVASGSRRWEGWTSPSGGRQALSQVGTTASGALRSMDQKVEGVANGAEETR